MFAAAKYTFASLIIAQLPLFGSVGTTIQALVCGPSSAPTIAQPIDGSTTAQASVTVSGFAEPNAAVEIFRNTTSTGTVQSAVDGSWSLGVALSVGSNTLYAESNTGCGVSPQSNQVTITRVQNPPPTPLLSAPPNGSSTTDSTTLVSGTAEAGSMVTIYRGTAAIGSVAASNTGNYSLNVPLVLGQNSLRATATNASGTSGFSATTVITRIQTPPPSGGGGTAGPAPSKPPASGISIVSPSDGTTTDRATIVVSGQAPAGATVTIMVNNTLAAVVIGDQAGNYSASVPLKLGVNTILVSLPNGSFATVQVNRAEARPLAPVITNPTNGQTVTDSVIVLKGRATPAETIYITLNGLEEGSVVADSEGNFSLSIELRVGRNTIIATARNSVGSSSSAAVQVIYQSSSLAPSVDDLGNGWLSMLNAIIAAIIGLPLLAQNGLNTMIFPNIVPPVAALGFLALGLALALMLRKKAGLLELACLFGIKAPPRGVTVRDAITGKIIKWPVVRQKGNIMSVAKKGYEIQEVPFESGEPISISLEPLPPRRTIVDHLVADGTWLIALFVIAISIDYAVYLGLKGNLLALFGAPIAFIALAQIRLAASAPHVRWGHIRGPAVAFGSGSKVELYSALNVLVAARPITPEGFYGLYAGPGDYTLKVKVPGWQFEDITLVKPKSGYITTRITNGSLGARPILPATVTSA